MNYEARRANLSREEFAWRRRGVYIFHLKTKHKITQFICKLFVHLILFTKINIKIEYVKAHTGKNDIHSIGNDMADKLAKYALGKTNENKICVRPPNSLNPSNNTDFWPDSWKKID